MKLDLLIKNGRVIDTGASIDKKMDLGVKNGRFADITQLDEPLEAERVLEAEGYIVTPGLIDSHVHVFDKGCDLGTSMIRGLCAVLQGTPITVAPAFAMRTMISPMASPGFSSVSPSRKRVLSMICSEREYWITDRCS